VHHPKPLPPLHQVQLVQQSLPHRLARVSLPAKARANPGHPVVVAARQLAAVAKAEPVAPPANSVGIMNSSTTDSSASGSNPPPSSSRINPSFAR
jgi:hypothetical protein